MHESFFEPEVGQTVNFEGEGFFVFGGVNICDGVMEEGDLVMAVEEEDSEGHGMIDDLVEILEVVAGTGDVSQMRARFFGVIIHFAREGEVSVEDVIPVLGDDFFIEFSGGELFFDDFLLLVVIGGKELDLEFSWRRRSTW